MNKPALTLLLSLASFALLAADAKAPPTEVHPVTDVYQGVSVTESYRWLENGADPKVKAWSAAQNQRARQYLDALPWRKSIYDRLFAMASASSISFGGLRAAGPSIFAYYNQPPKQQVMIATLPPSLDPKGVRVVVDPNTLNPKGTTAVDWFVPSPDGRLLAVSLSENGSEAGVVHIFDVANGKDAGVLIPRVQFPTGGGSLAWRADSKGFWYTRYPGEERPEADRMFYQQIYFHELGTDPAKDSYVAGKDLPRVAEIALGNPYNPNGVIATIENGDGSEFEHLLIDAKGVHQLSKFSDHIVVATLAEDGTIYLVSRDGAPRGKLLKLSPGVTDLKRATLLVAESDAVMLAGSEFEGPPVIPTKDAIYIREILGGPSRVAIYDHGGKSLGTLPLPDPATVSDVAPLGDGTLAYPVATYLKPTYFERYSEKSKSSAPTPLAQTSPYSFDDVEVVREMATSKDGTKVPMNIMRKKGLALNGANPVLLYGYGGYNISETPGFLSATNRLWFDAGGVFVDANLRGGGEFGEDWHAAGALTHKQNVFDDFIACAEALIKEKYTSPEHLAIMGGSNGGLLMGAALTQRPELFRAVISDVGIYDMLRVELDSNGSFNVTEYGSVKEPNQFKALYAYSPYHHVKDDVAYPAVFMQTGATDGRVNPAHSRKMIARLQAASSSGYPALLAIEEHSGHGIGSALSIRIGQRADAQSFLFDQLKMQLPK